MLSFLFNSINWRNLQLLNLSVYSIISGRFGGAYLGTLTKAPSCREDSHAWAHAHHQTATKRASSVETASEIDSGRSVRNGGP